MGVAGREDSVGVQRLDNNTGVDGRASGEPCLAALGEEKVGLAGSE